ncbi:MAG: M48 family metalloprotease [Oscillatoriales cyanobacterium RM2_1_1]|nr:M48 family metalloprotease [Oscillatoriales cyanobacterium RM2_1_1]
MQSQDLKSRIRAQMGLVTAWESLGNLEQAIAVCRSLTAASNARIQAWGTQTLERLTEKLSPSSSPSAPVSTGFVPFDSGALSQLPQPPQPSIPTRRAASSRPNPAIPETTPQTSGGEGSAQTNPSPPEASQPQPAAPGSSSAPADPSDRLNALQIHHHPGSIHPEELARELLQVPSSLDTADPQESSNPQSNPKAPEAPRNSGPQTPLIAPVPPAQPWQWRQAGRAEHWRRLKPLKLTRFQVEQGLTVIVLVWLTPRLVNFWMDVINDLLYRLPWVNPIQLLYRDPTHAVWITLGLLFLLSPWILDLWLKLGWGMETLPLTALFQQSPEANRILRSYCQKRRWRVPALRVLPISAPVAMTYGCWPRWARIVVSRGLLERLSEDEIALIYAREIAHVGHWDLLVMSFVTVVTQVPYWLYSQLPRWPDQLITLTQTLPGFLQILLSGLAYGLRGIAWVISPISYGVYRLLCWPAFWVSRRRVYYSDRSACDLTGNPNGLVRALLKITQGLAQGIEQRGQIDPMLESFNWLLPVAIKQAVTPGSLMFQTAPDLLLHWDATNPYRKWLELNQSHPLLGDRLQLLGFYTQFWQLESELDLPLPKGKLPRWTQTQRLHLLLQGAPFFGIPAGLLLGSLIWLIGGILSLLGLWQLEWLAGDRSVLWGCGFLGCGLGIFLRNNQFFPEIRRSNQLTNPDLRQLLANPEQIPLDTQPVRLEGQLLGKTGIKNFWEQDLILKTSAGLVCLHHVPQFTPLAYFWPGLTRPSQLVGQAVTVVGWWRRGAVPWIDLELLQGQHQGQKITVAGGHPFWVTLLGVAIACWGAYIIASGSG